MHNFVRYAELDDQLDSGEGRNPGKRQTPAQRDNPFNAVLSAARRYSKSWIPAFAGMTGCFGLQLDAPAAVLNLAHILDATKPEYIDI